MDTPDRITPLTPQSEADFAFATASDIAQAMVGNLPYGDAGIANVAVASAGTGDIKSEIVPMAPGIVDKKTWHTTAEAMVATAEKTGVPISVLFVDVNRFKDVNDTLGHGTGDVVIAEIKQLTASNVRVSSDERDNDTASVGEMGGDEVAAAIIGDVTAAVAVENRWRAAFDSFLLTPENYKLKDLGIGLAIGHATWQPGMSVSELLEAADKAMYADKMQQLPELTHDQEVILYAAITALKGAGVRLRDLPKYEQVWEARNNPS